MKQQTCKLCGSVFHTKMKCPQNEETKAKALATQKRMAEKQRLKQAQKPRVVVKKRKPTLAQIKKKIAHGGSLTVAEKKIQYKKQKDKAWSAFSTYIRHRDCLATTGTFERGTCVTCVVRGDYTEYPYSRIQAGHAVGGRGNAVLFHEEIVWGQHDHCNSQSHGGLSGDYGNYMTFLVRKYGLEHAESLQRLKNAYKDYTYEDLVLIEQEYKDKLEHLKSQDLRTKLF